MVAVGGAGILVGSVQASKHRAVTTGTVVGERSLTKDVDATLDRRSAGKERARL